MKRLDTGRVIVGGEGGLADSLKAWEAIPVDWDLSDQSPAPIRTRAQTIQKSVTVSGRGTFSKKDQTTITLHPSEKMGWRFQRAKYPDCLPVRVSAENVWTTGDIVSNIVLRSGPPHNYIRMVEHIIALRLGEHVDALTIEIDSGDPPLFNRGSMDLVDAIKEAGTRPIDNSVRYLSVKEPVTAIQSSGGFLTLQPCDPTNPALTIDASVNFSTAIGKQRIIFPMNDENYLRGAEARTNTSLMKMMFCRTLGKLFADIRRLGYTKENILIAGAKGYYNEPNLIHGEKSLEAVWHRSVLDLNAALALIEEGRFVGHVTSYCAGHRLDVDMIRKLYQEDLLEEVTVDKNSH